MREVTHYPVIGGCEKNGKLDVNEIPNDSRL